MGCNLRRISKNLPDRILSLRLYLDGLSTGCHYMEDTLLHVKRPPTAMTLESLVQILKPTRKLVKHLTSGPININAGVL